MFNINELLNKMVSIGAERRLTDMEFIERELTKWLSSPERKLMLDGERYYEGDHDILRKERAITTPEGEKLLLEGLPNNKIVDNLYRKMVVQKTNYLLGKPMTITTLLCRWKKVGRITKIGDNLWRQV